MAKKKETKEEAENSENRTATEKDIRDLRAKIEAIEQTLENFRTSFRNQDQALATLKERNRLR